MLDQLAQSETLYTRAVRPSYEGSMRPEPSPSPHLTRNEQQAVSRRAAVNQQRRETVELQNQVRTEEQQNPSRYAAQVADRLFQQVQQSRQEPARQSSHQRNSDYGQRQKLNQTYVTDPPITSKRFIDEIA